MGRQNKTPSPSRTASLADDVARLSRLLTKDRDALPAAYLQDPGLRQAYLAYFLPPNMAKIAVPLRELDLHPANIFAKTRLQVLDLGSGPGTAVLGIRRYFARSGRQVRLDFTAVDQVAENLREAEVLFREGGAEGPSSATLTTVRSGIEALAEHAGGPFDLIVLSNVLNELYLHDQDRVTRRIGLVGRILERLMTPDGSCIIIEPALRETSRDLLMVRDGLADGGATVFSPCLVQGGCPALENPKDWCHEDRPWDAPELIREIDSSIGLRKDSLKFSYLVLRKDGRTLAEICTEHDYRVVSEPLISKGKREFFLCGREGRRLATRLDKDVVPANRAFDALLRGDVVRFEGLVIEEKRFKITKETQVTPVHTAGARAYHRRDT
ncbi:MAG: small ribosomal subunit Rsm22 family protein [Nitrospirota bacterium]